jgi:hypothetical protein
MGVEASIILQVIYVVMQVVAEIWKSPVGDMFRDWYDKNKPKAKIKASEVTKFSNQ